MGDELFQPDAYGLRQAFERLIAARRASGEPMPTPAGAVFPTALPADGIGAEEALRWAIDVGITKAARLDHPGYLAHMDPPTPWPTWVAVTIAASANQNLLHPDAAPVARDLEARVIAWLAPAFGMDGGHLVPGSTLANLTALWAARELAGVRQVAASAAAPIGPGARWPSTRRRGHRASLRTRRGDHQLGVLAAVHRAPRHPVSDRGTGTGQRPVRPAALTPRPYSSLYSGSGDSTPGSYTRTATHRRSAHHHCRVGILLGASDRSGVWTRRSMRSPSMVCCGGLPGLPNPVPP